MLTLRVNFTSIKKNIWYSQNRENSKEWEKKLSTEINNKSTQILELAEKDFKASIITLLKNYEVKYVHNEQKIWNIGRETIFF